MDLLPSPELLRVMYGAAQALLERQREFDETLRAVAQLAVPEFADWTVIDLVERSGLLRRVVVHHRDPERRWAVEELQARPPDPGGPNGMAVAIRERRVEYVREVSPDLLRARAVGGAPHLAAADALGIRSWINAPLLAKDRALGAMSFVRGDSGRCFEDDDVRFARELANLVRLAVENARLFEDLRHAEASAREAAETQAELVAVVSHDLRTPLGAISASASVLFRRGGLSAEQAGAVSRIASSAARMEVLIRRTLDLTRIRTGQVVLDRRPVRLGEVAAGVVAELAVVYPGRMVAIEAEGEDEGAWDPDLVGQVLSNLLTNALQHGRSDAPVTVRIRRDGSTVRAEVHNAGEPIPPEILPTIFDKYRRGRTGRGVGLGLFIARALALAHGGELAVQSDSRGTVFTLSLPAGQAGTR